MSFNYKIPGWALKYKPYAKAIKRRGTKFIRESSISSETILFAQDGHIITTERVIEYENRTL